MTKNARLLTLLVIPQPCFIDSGQLKVQSSIACDQMTHRPPSNSSRIVLVITSLLPNEAVFVGLKEVLFQ